MSQMTVAEARAAGLLDRSPGRKRTTRKAAPRAGAVSRCVVCGVTFTTDAAEGRHMETERHWRYETVLT